MATRQEQLEAAAKRAGIVDIDAVKLADESKAADESIAALKAAKPYLFEPKMARDMTELERQEWWREHRKKFPS